MYFQFEFKPCKNQGNTPPFGEVVHLLTKKIKTLFFQFEFKPCKSQENLSQYFQSSIMPGRSGAWRNSFDCGIFVLLNIRYIVENLDPLFRDYSVLEFESIVELKPCKSQGNTPRLGTGRPSRAMFPLDPGHPLYGEYEAVIRVQFRTAVLAGHPPPTAGYCIIPTSPLRRNVFFETWFEVNRRQE